MSIIRVDVEEIHLQSLARADDSPDDFCISDDHIQSIIVEADNFESAVCSVIDFMKK